MDFKKSFVALCKTFQKSFLHLAYPSRCLHCSILLSPSSSVLCAGCASLLDLIHPEERCPTCFNLLPDRSSHLCDECRHYSSSYTRMAAAFDYEGPPATLIKRLKYGNQPYLAQGMASFLVAQWDRLKWPLPDALVPVPLSFHHWLERGYNQSALIAEEMGKILQCPVWHALKRQSGDYSQAALTLEQRQALTGKCFKLNLKYRLEGKMLIVIDDVMTSGSTLRRCGETLNLGHPASLYALTFCRTVSHV